MRVLQHVHMVLLAALLATAVASPAQAYIDAGTGGLILQALLAGVAGAVVIVKMYWQKIVGFFRRES